jgi:hypothetical protein
MRLKILVEGPADVPTVRTILQRRFGLQDGSDFEVQPHQGKGRLPAEPNARPDPTRRGLLCQLPAKLRGMSWDRGACVVVLVDADRDDCEALLADLRTMLAMLTARPPRVLFRIAIEETESWFIADTEAVRAAYPRARTESLRRIRPDAVCGAWERLAFAVGAVTDGRPIAHKLEWAERIPPHLDLDSPRSPSLAAFVRGVERELRLAPPVGSQ